MWLFSGSSIGSTRLVVGLKASPDGLLSLRGLRVRGLFTLKERGQPLHIDRSVDHLPRVSVLQPVDIGVFLLDHDEWADPRCFEFSALGLLRWLSQHADQAARGEAYHTPSAIEVALLTDLCSEHGVRCCLP